VCLLVARTVFRSKDVLIIRTPGTVAGQIAFVRACFRMHEVFEFFERSLRRGNGKEASA
jgi:hypothetical protein